MTKKTKTNCKMLVEINCGLDNIKEIMTILYETIEDYNTPAEIEKRPLWLLHQDLVRVQKLSFIFDNEFERIRQTLKILLEEVE